MRNRAMQAKYRYGPLREAWEPAPEEVLLGGVVERHRTGVQTQQIAQIADINAEDCKADIDAFATWVAAIRKRLGSGTA